jgi:hypothetical protein
MVIIIGQNTSRTTPSECAETQTIDAEILLALTRVEGNPGTILNLRLSGTCTSEAKVKNTGLGEITIFGTAQTCTQAHQENVLH